MGQMAVKYQINVLTLMPHKSNCSVCPKLSDLRATPMTAMLCSKTIRRRRQIFICHCTNAKFGRHTNYADINCNQL
mgnify:CR=1 FL=1